jgi:hypothetical protein
LGGKRRGENKVCVTQGSFRGKGWLLYQFLPAIDETPQLSPIVANCLQNRPQEAFLSLSLSLSLSQALITYVPSSSSIHIISLKLFSLLSLSLSLTLSLSLWEAVCGYLGVLILDFILTHRVISYNRYGNAKEGSSYCGSESKVINGTHHTHGLLMSYKRIWLFCFTKSHGQATIRILIDIQEEEVVARKLGVEPN